MSIGTIDQVHGIRIIEDFDKAMTALKTSYEYMKERVEDMEKTLDEWNKDEEIQQLKKEKKDVYNHSLLQLSNKEVESLRAFRDKHFRECCGNGQYKAKGNTWIYTISGTGLGHVIEITCPECGQSEDVTDIDSW